MSWGFLKAERIHIGYSDTDKGWHATRAGTLWISVNHIDEVEAFEREVTFDAGTEDQETITLRTRIRSYEGGAEEHGTNHPTRTEYFIAEAAADVVATIEQCRKDELDYARLGPPKPEKPTEDDST